MLAAFLPLVGPLVEKLVGLIPDPAEKERARAQALQQLMDFAAKADAAQLEVNKAEAQSGSFFVAGWRPFVGWVCAAGCAWNWLGLPVGLFVVALVGKPLEVAPLDISEMLPLLLGLLGMGGLRTYEKMQGVSREGLRPAKEGGQNGGTFGQG